MSTPQQTATDTAAMRGCAVQGIRHDRPDGRSCNCGCARVAGLQGQIIEANAAIDVAICEFAVLSPAGGAPNWTKIAYTFTEIGQ